MKNRLYLLIVTFAVVSCAEKVVKEPENLIPIDKMEQILYDIAIINAAKNIDVQVLRKNSIEAMEYIYAKYGVDSIQFVESDIYYASIPSDYEAMYSRILDSVKIRKEIADELQKKYNDSIAEAAKKTNKPPVLDK